MSAKATHLAACALAVGLVLVLVVRGEADAVALAILLLGIVGVRGIYAATGHDQLRIADVPGRWGSRGVRALGYGLPIGLAIVLAVRLT